VTQQPIAHGKVREIYAHGAQELILVASDRISAYDVIMPTAIPDKGRVLTAMSRFWFSLTDDLVANHVLGMTPDELPEAFRTDEFAGRTMRVRRLEMINLECVARGYLAGSGWREYQETGMVVGHRLPAGLRLGDRLPEPIFTPATKATSGHDENITREDAAAQFGTELVAELEALTLAIYTRAHATSAEAGIILADTKFEFGRDPNGTIVLGDEVLTPDSSRFWPHDTWTPGTNPASYDKQYVRDWLDASGWDHTPPGPELPEEVVTGTRERYIQAYERITGHTFDDYLEEMHVGAQL
jgi:phosphoribosylaminoimidazole-succinocarboxamide synthase